MDNTSKPVGHLSAFLGIGLLLIGLSCLWSGPTERPGAIKRNSPKALKLAWRALRSKQSLKVPRPEAVLTAEQLQNHFDGF